MRFLVEWRQKLFARDAEVSHSISEGKDHAKMLLKDQGALYGEGGVGG